MLLTRDYLNIYLVKLIADMESVKYPTLTELVIGTSCASIVEEFGESGGYEPFRRFLESKNVSPEISQSFKRDVTRSYIMIDQTELASAYFQLEHIQKTVRRHFFTHAPSKFGAILKYTLSDSQWTYISSKLTEFYKMTTFPFIPKDQGSIVGYYLSQIKFAVLNGNLMEDGLTKVGLDTDIGDSTLTYLANQSETHSEEFIRSDLLDFDKIATDIYNASAHLYSRTPNGGDTYVFFDLVSNHKMKIMNRVQDKLKVSLKNVVSGATRYIPNVRLSSLLTYPLESSVNVVDDLEARVQDRAGSLRYFDEMLTGVADTTRIMKAMEYHYNANHSPGGGKTDGKYMYRTAHFDSILVHRSLETILKGYGSLRKLLDYCNKTGVNFLTIPTVAFRKPGLSKNFSTLNEYINLVELTETLSEESRFLDSERSGIYSEKMLQARDLLRGTRFSDVYYEDDEGKKIMEDLHFLLDFVAIKRGKYDPSNITNNPKLKNGMVVVNFLREDNKVIYTLWDTLKKINRLVEVDGYKVTNADGSGESMIATYHEVASAPSSAKLLEGSMIKWDQPVDTSANVVFNIIAKILCGMTGIDEASMDNFSKFALVIQSQRMIAVLTDVVLRFLDKMFNREINKEISVNEYGPVIKDSSAALSYFLGDIQLSKLVDLPSSFEEKKNLLAEFKIIPEYTVGANDNLMESALISLFDFYVEMYKDVFSFLRFLHRVSVDPIMSLFSVAPFAITNIKREDLERFCNKLYNSPHTEGFMNQTYVQISQNYPKDEYLGIFKDASGKGPLLVKDYRNRPTYLHETGHLIHIEVTGIMLETPIEKDTVIIT